jgi:hypothetical protein
VAFAAHLAGQAEAEVRPLSEIDQATATGFALIAVLMQDLAAASAAVRLGLGRQIFVDAQKKHMEIAVQQRMVAHGRRLSILADEKMRIPSLGDRTMTIPEGD